MAKKSCFHQFFKPKHLQDKMKNLNQMSLNARFINDIRDSLCDPVSQISLKQNNFGMKGSKSFDPNRRKSIDKESLEKEFEKFLISQSEGKIKKILQNDQLITKDQQDSILEKKTSIHWGKLLTQKYQTQSVF